jgi:hypothetical protein
MMILLTSPKDDCQQKLGMQTLKMGSVHQDVGWPPFTIQMSSNSTWPWRRNNKVYPFGDYV